MDIGINTSPRGAFGSREAYMQVAALAERTGFDFLSVSDHVVIPQQNASRYPYNEDGKLGANTLGYCLEQLTTLAFLAGCTSRLRLLASVMVVPHRPPVLAAKAIATADVLSGGRIVLGIGAGWLREEFEALGAGPYDQRGRVTDEYIAAFRELWTSHAPSYNGHHVKVRDIVFEPKPVQQPGPPIWVGGESRAAMRRAVHLGDAWYPGSRNPEFRLDTPERVGAAWGQMQGMAEAAQRDPASLALAYIIFSPVEWTARPGHDTPRRLMTGSAAEMAADIAALRAVGVRHLNLSFQTPTIEETLEGIERFGREVLPLVRS